MSVNKELLKMAKRQRQADKMAGTGIRRIKGEDYPFGEMEQNDISFSELYDAKAADEAALQLEAARKAEERRRQRAAGIQDYPPPQETLDLHGCTGQEAEDKTRYFLDNARNRGLQTVRVITGKGLHSPGGRAILPDLIEQQLTLLKKEAAIIAFQWEKKVKSRSGALVVYL